MACRRSKTTKVQKNKEFRRKLHILRNLVNSNSDKTSSIIMDAFQCISALTLRLEELKKESMNQHVKHVDDKIPLLEVKVEKQGENSFRLNVKSEKGKDNLVQILEAFEEMAGIDVINARVSCITLFVMEATIKVSQAMDINVLSEAILKAIERSTFNN